MSVCSTPTSLAPPTMPLELVPSNSTTGFFKACGDHESTVARNLFHQLKKPGTHSIQLSFHPQNDSNNNQQTQKNDKLQPQENANDTKMFTVVYEVKSRLVKYCTLCFPSSCFAAWCCCCVGTKLEQKHLIILSTPEKNIELGRAEGTSKEEACLLVCHNIITVVHETLSQQPTSSTCSCLFPCSFSCMKTCCPCCISSAINRMVSAKISPSPPPPMSPPLSLD